MEKTKTNGKGYDLVIFVGETHYPTPEDFIKEATERGACRRVRTMPTLVEPGKTRVWMLHKDGLPEGARVIGYFTVDEAEKLSSPVTLTDVEKARGVTATPFISIGGETPRGCGRRKFGAVYLKGGFKRTMAHVIDPCIKFFRGYGRVLREDLLAQIDAGGKDHGIHINQVGSTPTGMWA